MGAFLKLGFEMRVSEGAGFPRLLEEAALEFLEVLRKTIS